MDIPPSLAPVHISYPPLSAMSPTAPEVSFAPANSPPPLEAVIPSPVSLVSPISPLLPKPPIPSLISSPPPPLTKILVPPITSPPPLFNELPYPSLDSPPPPLHVTSLPRDPPPPRSPPMFHPPPIAQMTPNKLIGLIVGVSVGCVLLFAVFGVFCFCCMKKRKRENKPVDHYRPPVVANNICYEALPAQKKKFGSKRDFIITVMPNRCLDPPLIGSNGDSNSNDSGSDNTFSPQGPGIALGYSRSIFTYEELAVATNGFSEANLLGQGGFGYVHKGILPNGREIAVKKLKAGSSQGDREFQAEVETISRVHHKHLVTLVGYCCTEGERLLVYEFVPNNTLEFHLHDKEQAVMNWPTRLKIAIGSAKGLAYLHEDCNPTIIHRDIKSSNILIDHNLEAKVSDFGLAKFFSDTNRLITHISTRVVGTFGYLAPEYANCGKVTDKSDVFSYGVVLLELITGRVPINTTASCTYQSLYEWARPLLKQALEERNFDALVDPRLQKTYKLNEMASMVACAAACVRHSAWLRPRMSQIVRVLEGDISLSVLNEGTRPGDSATNGPNGSLNIDLNYLEDMHNWSTREFGARDSSEIASPSGSSTDDTHIIPERQNKKDE